MRVREGKLPMAAVERHIGRNRDVDVSSPTRINGSADILKVGLKEIHKFD